MCYIVDLLRLEVMGDEVRSHRITAHFQQPHPRPSFAIRVRCQWKPPSQERRKPRATADP